MVWKSIYALFLTILKKHAYTHIFTPTMKLEFDKEDLKMIKKTFLIFKS